MSELTDDQKLVADSDSYVMCCALPGSGKSHTMVALADNLVSKDSHYKLLLITFTRAAADELNERLSKKISNNNNDRVLAATFDSVFGQQVRRGDVNAVKKRTIVGGDQYNFIERAIAYAKASITVDEAQEFIDRYGRMLQAKAIKTKSGEIAWKVYQAYLYLMKINNLQDFNSIAKAAYLGVQTGSFSPWDATHILVDEFQDTSEMQYAWLKLHGEKGAKLVVVGDDDQSIYSWRGAVGYQNMVNFQSDFDTKSYILNSCFRCRPEILDAASSVIQFNEDRVDKEMISNREPGGVVEIIGNISEYDEFEKMVETILSNNKKWAILARTNRVLDSVETCLKCYQIPYRRLGGKNFWDNNVAKIALKLLFSLIRPENSQYIEEILGWLKESESIICHFREYLQKNLNSFGNYMPSDDFEWSENTEKLHLNWYEWLRDTDCKVEMRRQLDELFEFVKSARGVNNREAKVIAFVIDTVVSMNMKDGLVDRIELLARNLSSSKRKKTKDEDSKNAVTLSTFHSSKGLQWDQVWIVQSNQGVCPSNLSLDDKDENGESIGVDEERRLYYVGMTRAIDELYISFSCKRGGKLLSPSQFLFEGFPSKMQLIMENLYK